MKHYYLLPLLLLISWQTFSQTKYKSPYTELPKNVASDFAKSVNYSWYYANNADAFKGALIPILQRRGLTSQFEIERTIQDVGKSKNCRDLVLNALVEYTGLARLKEILENMDIPANSARVLTAYAYHLQQPTNTAITVVDKPIKKTNVNLVKSPDDLDPSLSDLGLYTKDDLFSPDFPQRNIPAGPLTYGVITSIKNDNQNNPLEVMIYFKGKHSLKGTYDDVFFEDDKFASSISPEKLDLLKKILVPGRKVSFKTFWIGSSAGHDALAYLKVLSKNFILPINND